MTTAKQSFIKYSAIIFIVAVSVNALLTIISTYASIPSDSHKRTFATLLQSDVNFAQNSEFDSEKEIENLGMTYSELLETPESKYITSVSTITWISFMVINLGLIIFAYRFARSSFPTGNVESLVTLSVGLGIFVEMLISTLLVGMIVGVNTSALVLTTNWIILFGLFWLLLVTLLLVGIVVHVLEKRHKKRHSFVIE